MPNHDDDRDREEETLDPALFADLSAETVVEPWDDPARRDLPDAYYGEQSITRPAYLGQPRTPTSPTRPDPTLDRSSRLTLTPSQEQGVAALESVMEVTGGAGSRDVGRGTAPPEISMTSVIQFDADQQQAIEACGQHLYTNISGTAGVGKTFVAKEIMRRYPGVLLAATTGIASVNLGEGTTINALLHYFNTADLRTKYLEGVLKRIIGHLRRAGIRRILIDEKSMMAGQQLTYIARAVRESNEEGIYALEDVGAGETAIPDGSTDRPTREEPPPMGLTLVGDFGQLPPVPDTEEIKDPATGERTYKKIPVQFAFDSPEWPLFAAHTTTLTTIYRQEAKDFITALHAIRRGDVTTALHFFTADRFSDTQDDQFDGSTIFAKNEQVDRYNQLRLDALPGEKLIARSIRQGEQRPDWKQIPETLVLKEGALVMLLANRRVYETEKDSTGRLVYANGDLATLLGKGEQGEWLAQLYRNQQQVIVYPVIRENAVVLRPGRRKQIKLDIKVAMDQEGFRYINDLSEQDDEDDTSYANILRIADGVDRKERSDKLRTAEEFRRRLATKITEKGKGKFEIIGTITYMPLRAAYGCTVHKTQGLTLDRVQVNIRDPFFRQPGMLFVALSRARTAEGLRIVGDPRGFVERCRIEPRVQPWL